MEPGGPTKCPGWKTPWGVDLSGLDFTGADFTGARIRNSDLSGTNFTNANLFATQTMDAIWSSTTQLRGARVRQHSPSDEHTPFDDKNTFLDNLVPDQQVPINFSVDSKRYLILDGVKPGRPERFRPKATPQGVTIDECTRFGGPAATVHTSINGEDVALQVLPPGTYRATCTFFTAGREQKADGRGYTFVGLTVK